MRTWISHHLEKILQFSTGSLLSVPIEGLLLLKGQNGVLKRFKLVLLRTQPTSRI